LYTVTCYFVEELGEVDEPDKIGIGTLSEAAKAVKTARG
jgi:hypothetical protein